MPMIYHKTFEPEDEECSGAFHGADPVATKTSTVPFFLFSPSPLLTVVR